MTNLIGIIGERYENFVPHSMLEKSLDWLKEEFDFEYQWVDTLSIHNDKSILHDISGIWSAPGSPFKSLNGALVAIQFAREHNIPHLGTCAGFQHAIIEFARNTLNIQEAQHEEYESSSEVLFITKLACSLSGTSMEVKLKENTIAHQAYQKLHSTEDYYCHFGISPKYLEKFQHPELLISGTDQDGEIRIIEYPKLRFFVLTLFVPQSRSTKEKVHPLIRQLVHEAIR
jgi:CTP synthase (UTP-ammonia lyase)